MASVLPQNNQKLHKTFSEDIQEQQKQWGNDCIRLDFQNVCLDVKVPGGTKRILNNISGYVNPGEILYIMGPSGGGKTSLLDFLCNRTKQEPSQYMYLNGQKWKENEFKKVAKYCQQYPQLYEVLTVQETLEYAASFYTKSRKQRDERVDNVIGLLGLEEQRDIKIGGIFFRGISGGQQKRVSIGECLVANPKILFLDEPTSGLDSASAFKLVEKLHDITRKTGITVLTSIHQPSFRVFDMSDRLLILAGGQGFGGNVAYFGKTAEIDNYFERVGIKNNTTSSMSEWILDQVNGDFGEKKQIQQMLDCYKASDEQKELEFIGKQVENKGEIYKFYGQSSKQSYIKDILCLMHRGLKITIKNPQAFIMRVISYCFMSFIIGTVWWQIADEPDAGDVQDMNGVTYFIAEFFVVMTISVLPNQIEDRLIMVKEKTNGSYKLGAFSFSQFVVSIPFAFIVSVLPGIIVYYMVGFKEEEAAMFIFNLFLCVVASEALMLIVASIFSHLLICIVLVALIIGSFIIMNGFYIKKPNIPDGWIWLHYSAFNTYTFQNFMKAVYEGTTIEKNLNIVPPALESFEGERVLEDYHLEDVDYFVNIIAQIGFIVGFRLLSHIYSHYKHTGKK